MKLGATMEELIDDWTLEFSSRIPTEEFIKVVEEAIEKGKAEIDNYFGKREIAEKAKERFREVFAAKFKERIDKIINEACQI